MRKAGAGFSLIESLVVLVIVALVAIGSATALGSVRRPEETVASTALHLHRRGVTLALLREDFGRTSEASERRLRIALGDTDAVAVLGPGPESPLVSEYSIGTDGGARTNLYRRSGSASRQPAVQGVVGLDVVSLVDRSGAIAVRSGTFSDILALDLELAFSWGERLRLHLPLGTRTTV